MSGRSTIASILLAGGVMLVGTALASETTTPPTTTAQKPCRDDERRVIGMLDRQTKPSSNSLVAARDVEKLTLELTNSREFVEFLRCLSER